MRKKITFDHPNKMHFESAHKTFNEQTTYLNVGACIASTQYSDYIRPFTETACNGIVNKEGHLQAFDLQPFQSWHIPYAVIQDVRNLTKEIGGILYAFFHYNGTQRILDGCVFTDEAYHHVRTWYVNNHWRSIDAVDKATEYIVEMPEVSEGA